jgi:hypothetical protein
MGISKPGKEAIGPSQDAKGFQAPGKILTKEEFD